MTPRIHCLIVAVSLPLFFLGCSDPGPSVSAEQLHGRWEFDRQANSSCGGASGDATYYFRVRSGSIEPSGVLNIVEPWDIQPQPRFDWTVTGNINVEARTVELSFWHTVLETGAEFVGTIDLLSLQVTGTLRDPKPGYNPHFTAFGPCTFQMTGRRAGS